MRDKSYQNSVDFLQRFFGETTEHAVELRSFLNVSDDGTAKRVFTREGETIELHCQRFDDLERGMFFGVCTRRRGASKGTYAELMECPALWVDVDCLKRGLAKDDVVRALLALPFAPSVVIDSGGGIHGYWMLNEAEAIEGSDRDHPLNGVLAQLAGVVAGDTKVCDLARVMRLPGTLNTKPEVIEANGAPAIVALSAASWNRYDLSDLVDWLDWQRPVLALPKSEGAQVEDNPFLAASRRMGFKPTLDVEQALAAMNLGGDGDTSIHQTQLRVSASLCAKGIDEDEIVSVLLEATRAAAGAAGQAWNWKREEAAIRRMTVDGRVKFGQSAQVISMAEKKEEMAVAVAAGGGGSVASIATKSGKKSEIAHIGDATIEYWQSERGPLISVAGELATYRDGYWTIFGDAETHALRVAIQGVMEAQDIAPRTSTLNAAWRYIVERPSLMREGIEWNASGLVICRNGAIDPSSGTMHSHSPEHFASYRIEADIEVAATCSTWLEFLSGCLSNLPGEEQQAVIATLQEWFGAALVRSKSREMTKALLAYGPSRSGKTQLAQVLRALVGGKPSGMRARDLEDKFGMQALVSVSAWIADDAVSSGDYLDAERFKVIVTGEPISIPRKNLTNWEGRLDLPVALTSNHLPRVKDQSDAVYNRSLILPMTVVRNEANSSVVPISETIIAKELGGVLNWAIHGWKRLRERGHFVPPAHMIKAIENYKADNNPVGTWLAEAVVFNAWSMVDRRDVRASFLGWYAQEFGEGDKAPGGRWLFPSVRQAIPEIKDHSSGGNRYLIGVKLTEAGLAFLKHAQDTSAYGKNAGSGETGASINRAAPSAKTPAQPSGKQPRF